VNQVSSIGVKPFPTSARHLAASDAEPQ
jgi:hypothetical protein